MQPKPGRLGWPIVCTLLALVSLASLAGAARVPEGYDPSHRPDPEGPPTSVQVAVFVIDITKIDDIDQSFTASLYFRVGYKDPRLADPAAPGERIFSLDQIWWPDLGLINRRDLQTIFANELRVDPEGNVVYRQRVYGDFSARLNLRAFPFDTQTLPIEVTAYSLGPDEVTLVADKAHSGRLHKLSLAGWSIQSGSVDMEARRTEDLGLSELVFRLPVVRKVSFYRWSILIPLCFIILMAWCVFWIDPQYLPTQVGLSTATVFSLIAFRFSLRSLLPQVDYTTYLDEFVLGATILVFLALGQAITTGRLAKMGREPLADRIDVWSRSIYLVLFVLMTAVTLRLNF
jgi:hypothetical protein